MSKKRRKTNPVIDDSPDIALLIARSIVAVLFGVFLYLSLPIYSMWSIAIIPLVCGTFAWLVVRDAYFGAASGILAVTIGAIFAWQLINRGFLISFGTFFAVQVILGAIPALIAKLIKSKINTEYVVLGLLIVVMLNFVVIASISSSGVAAASVYEPPAEAYAFDGIFFLKMFYLVEQGNSFYEAYDLGFQQDKRFDHPPSIIGGWRMPTTFWLWSAIANSGDNLVGYFIIFSLISMICSYLIARKFTEPVFAFLGPCIIGTYMLFGVSSWWYTELEYWGLFLALPAATLYLYDKRYWALPLAILAGLMREWVALILIAGLIDNLVRRRWLESGIWAGASALVGGAYIINIYNIIGYMKQANLPLSLEGGGMGQGGIGFILYTLQFGSTYFTGGLALVYILFFTGIVGTILSGVRDKNFYWVALAFLPLMAFMVYGSGRVPGDPPGWNDYYNINFMPYILLAIPLAAKPLVDASLSVLRRINLK